MIHVDIEEVEDNTTCTGMKMGTKNWCIILSFPTKVQPREFNDS